MKRYGNIYHKIYDMNNLELAHKNAREDKSFYREVQMVDNNKDYCLRQIQDMLKNKTYSLTPDDYTMFKKKDKNKIREIYKLDYFPHRIIQWALILQVQDILLKSFIDNTFSSIPERGIHSCLQKLDRDLREFPEETQYCLKMDIEKFYPNVNHEINKRQWERKFKDKDLLWLVFMIIDSMEGEKGIAIGSLFSQWDGNFYLTPFDHWLKEEMKVRYYYRYMDDLVILSSDKEWLHYMRKEIQEYLKEELDLKLKENYQIFPVDVRGIDFVGYRHFRNYILLRKSTSKDLIRTMRDIMKKLENGVQLTYSEWCSINAYKGWLRWCNGHNLYEKWIEPLEPYCKEYYNKNVLNK
jgi:RNA-directed DNA polymerase